MMLYTPVPPFQVLEMEPENKEAKRELEKLRDASNSRENDRLRKEQERVQNPPQVVREEGKGSEQKEETQTTVPKRKGNGKKVKIIEVNSSQEDRIPLKPNQILPIEKPPHLRSKVSVSAHQVRWCCYFSCFSVVNLSLFGQILQECWVIRGVVMHLVSDCFIEHYLDGP